MENIKNNTSEKLNDFIEQAKEEDLQVNIFSKKKTTKPSQEFVMVFHSNFYQLFDEFNLAKNDMKVLFVLFEYLSYGNTLQLTLQTIANRTGIEKSNVSRIFSKLEKAKILYRDEGRSLFLNPMFIVKGSLTNAKESIPYKTVKNEIYQELKPKIKDEKMLDKAVHKKLPF